MKLHTVLAAFLCLAACALHAQNRTAGQTNGNSRNGLLSSSAGHSSSSPSGRTSNSASGRSASRSSANDSAGRGIFDIATKNEHGGNSAQPSPAASRNATAASPFGTTSPRTKSASTRRWKTTSKLADCIREKAVPANTNFSFSGTVTNVVTDGRYTILTMFDSVSTVTENGATGDVPVTFTVVMDAQLAGSSPIKENARKSFTVDSNYVYFVWNDTGCTVRAIDNSLTDPDPVATSATNKR